MSEPFHIRAVEPKDIAFLEELIRISARELSRETYTQKEIDAAIEHVFGVDTELVEDGTYYTVLNDAGAYMACGGWSRRRTLFGGDHFTGREEGLLDPKRESAKIRAFFVHPDHARKGIGKALLEHCEAQARSHGFQLCEMMATLPGVKLYEKFGYVAMEECLHAAPDGTRIRFVRMAKRL